MAEAVDGARSHAALPPRNDGNFEWVCRPHLALSLLSLTLAAVNVGRPVDQFAKCVNGDTDTSQRRQRDRPTAGVSRCDVSALRALGRTVMYVYRESTPEEEEERAADGATDDITSIFERVISARSAAASGCALRAALSAPSPCPLVPPSSLPSSVTAVALAD